MKMLEKVKMKACMPQWKPKFAMLSATEIKKIAQISQQD